MNQDVPKQYLSLEGRPILGHTLLVFDSCDRIDEVLVVIAAEDFDFCRQNVISPLHLQKRIRLVAGGDRRQDSVYNGLKALDQNADLVVIHDGVRPFVKPEELVACIDGAIQFNACILGIPASDTLKRVDQAGIISETLARDNIWLVQTPQVFKYDLILKAHEAARKDGVSGTDDAFLAERLGSQVRMITGSKNNIKITTREDLVAARAILAKR
jgi:2-C-methyl-D-erythritol 4-phosphate cytidylyltransferase